MTAVASMPRVSEQDCCDCDASQVEASPDTEAELVGTNVEDQLLELGERTTADAWIDDDAVELYDPFVGNFFAGSTDDIISKLSWKTVLSGAGAQIADSGIAISGGRGVAILGTGTTTSGRAGMNLNVSQFDGSPSFTFRWKVQVPLLATGPQDYDVVVGFSDESGAGSLNDGFVFIYARSILGGNWWVANYAGGSNTPQNTGTAVAAGTWYELKAVCTGTAVHYYIDDVEVTGSPLTTNLPGGGDRWAPACSIAKKAGTTARNLYADDFRARIEAA